MFPLDRRTFLFMSPATVAANAVALLGTADVDGEFNDAAKKYDLHKIGPKVWAYRDTAKE